MFITKLLPFFLFYASIVRSSDISNDAYKQIHNVNRAARGVDKYNHPSEEAIPVAIVFDNNITREENSIDNKVSKSRKDTSSQMNTDETPTLIKLRSDFSVKSSNVDTVKVRPSAKIITEDDLQIPVAVIYDEEPTTVRNRKKVLRRNKVGNQGQSNRRRVQKVEATILENEHTTVRTTEQTTHIEITTSTEKSKEQKGTKQTLHNKEDVKQLDPTIQNSRKRPVVPIIQSENKVFGNTGDFHYSYEGGDGTKAFVTGELKSFDNDKAGEAVVGSFSYTDKDGQDFSLSYTADENGYRPVGAHLPTPPPIPPAIERALRYLATKTTPEPVTESVADAKEDS